MNRWCTEVDEPKCGEELSKEQYDSIMQEIVKNHRFAKGGRHIKYIDPHWDMRDGMCFAIQFRGLFGNGRILFDGRQSERSMSDRIMSWLDGEDDTEAKTSK
ncbi:hypothetical protein [Paenibacillus rigui]|uniref:Uncharacterized protein n=1 Tax=Paenibacillus rigui TaxID=554312 RepID=A0A229UKK5_9BACL|nr:hypothetical protein [Paenibacillus rigui]OXM83987.1 hypothetical protein CF651_23020 [Paenibacillus rigui]